MSADDEVARIAVEVVNRALSAAFPSASLAELSAAARLLGMPAVGDAVMNAEAALRNLGDQIAAAQLPMTDPTVFWHWYYEHADTTWTKTMSGIESTWRVAKQPHLRKGADSYGKPERWAWEFQIEEVGERRWSRETLRYPHRLLDDGQRIWTPVVDDGAAGDRLLHSILHAELALHGEGA